MTNKIWQFVARKLSGEASLDELRELELLLKENPGLAYEVHLYIRYFENPGKNERAGKNKADALQRFRERLLQEELMVSASKKSAPAKRRLWLGAASIAAFLLVAFWAFQVLRKTNVQNQAPLVSELKTMPGTRSKAVLPDGSIVWLNSESNISYNKDFGVEKREVYLTGEAFFDVVKKENTPFIVHAQTVKVVVKGTAFNVRSYPQSEKVQTSLIRGAVEVITEDDPSHPIVLKPKEKVTVQTGKQEKAMLAQTIDKKSNFILEPLKVKESVQVIPEVSWVNDQLVFDNEQFGEVVDKMEKWYNVEFLILNERMTDTRFSADFEDENLKEALEALQYVRYFDFEIVGRKVIIK